MVAPFQGDLAYPAHPLESQSLFPSPPSTSLGSFSFSLICFYSSLLLPAGQCLQDQLEDLGSAVSLPSELRDGATAANDAFLSIFSLGKVSSGNEFRSFVESNVHLNQKEPFRLHYVNGTH